MSVKGGIGVRLELKPEIADRVLALKAKLGEGVTTQEFLTFVIKDWLQGQETES